MKALVVDMEWTKAAEWAELLPVGVFGVDAEGLLLYANACWGRLTGSEGDEVTGLPWVAAVHPKMRGEVVAGWKAAVARRESFVTCFRVRGRPGAQQWIRVQLASLSPPLGSCAFVGAAVDVSDEVRLKRELEAGARRLAHAVEATGLALWEVDLRSSEVYLSGSWGALLGLPQQERIAPLSKVLPYLERSEDGEALQAFWLRLLAGESDRVELEHRLCRACGDVAWVLSQARVSARAADGRPLRIVGSCMDIGDRRRSDGALRSTGATPAASILLVEDTEVNQLVARRMLERLGYERITIAANGREALAACRAQPFDLILMDCQMPEMDGLQATRELRARGLRTPIVAFTTRRGADDRDRCLEAGMNDHLAKPADMAALAEKVGHWLGVHTWPAAAAASRPIGGTPVAFDRATLGRSLEADGEAIACALGVFERQTGPGLDALEQSLLAGDIEQARSIAHRVLGGAAMLGALRLAQRCRQIERSEAADATALMTLLALARQDYAAFLEDTASLRHGPGNRE
ncbi:response regulator [Ramlibacter sp. AN1133]|uniref:response regulator n=1 Tax=Ramlibacter sp. AN1133 TaxID=3133429 RepID=UPI0030C31A56